jgi:hypothetical protein
VTSPSLNTRARNASGDCPACTAIPIWVPYWSKILNSLRNSISLSFWLITSTGSASRLAGPAPAR